MFATHFLVYFCNVIVIHFSANSTRKNIFVLSDLHLQFLWSFFQELLLGITETTFLVMLLMMNLRIAQRNHPTISRSFSEDLRGFVDVLFAKNFFSLFPYFLHGIFENVVRIFFKFFSLKLHDSFKNLFHNIFRNTLFKNTIEHSFRFFFDLFFQDSVK